MMLRISAAGLLLFWTACATVPERGDPSAVSALQEPGGGGTGLRAVTARAALAATPGEPYGTLLQAAGFDPERLSGPDPLTPGHAAFILWQIRTAPTTPLATFGPRLVLAHVMREVEAGGAPVPKASMRERLARFRRLAVLRPDGYLASALTGTTLQRALGPLEVRDGTLKAAGFELGRFYDTTGGVFRSLNDHLERVDWTPLDEVRDDADVINRALDGAQDAMVELAVVLGRLVVHPIQSVSDLQHLPRALMALIESSPAYFERFRLMTRGEQIQALAKLVTTLVLSTETAGGTTTRLTTAADELGAVSVPVMTLAEDGTLAVTRVAVPAGRMATVIGGGPGAVYVLHMAGQTAGAAGTGGKWVPPTGGPGKWVEKAEAMKSPAKKYQTQITGAPEGWVYRVENVKLRDGRNIDKVDCDGYLDGALVEVKGPNYKQFLDSDGQFMYWFRETEADGWRWQAERQLAAANGRPVRWYVAEREVADAIRSFFSDDRLLRQIEIIYAPVLP